MMNPEDLFFDNEGLEDEPERVMSAASDDDPPDMPPIDPPVLPRGREGAQVAGAIDEIDEEYYTADEPMSDDEITARVRRALRMDAATSMLRILVTTEDGVVTLQGTVQTLEDTDNAIEVASRIPNVVDVVDELEVE
ncbi:MAG TPA: BON domain-containing protein [Chloroflexota bacterium]|jgi:hypothetical protein|nr:BON domain-containing protein [Chloroflexota bacterium]